MNNSVEVESDVVRVARMAKDAMYVSSQNEYWRDYHQRESVEKITLADIARKKEHEAATLKENAFQFKVKTLVDNGMNPIEAMDLANEINMRNINLTNKEKQLEKERQEFEFDRDSIRAKYFVGGSVTTMLGFSFFSYMSRM